MSEEKNGQELETIKDETSGALDVVTDLLSDTVIPAPIRRNAWKAFKQLCTAAIEVPVAYLEGKAAEIRTGTESRVKIMKENADQIAEQMNVPPEYARRAANKFAEKIIREQVNLDTISAVAADELHKDESTNPTEPNTDDTAEKTISDDWLNSFEKEASQKNTEEMQLMFGRILAGQIGKPGTYSIKAVKMLGALDQKAATLFKLLCSLSVVLGHLPSKYVRDGRVCFLDEQKGFKTLCHIGLTNTELHILEEYGLIQSSFYESSFPYDVCVLKGGDKTCIPFRHQGKDWFLVPLTEQAKHQELNLWGVAFSTVGCELFNVVDQDVIAPYTEELHKLFAGKHLQMIDVNSQKTS